MNMCEHESPTNVGSSGLHIYNSHQKKKSKPFTEDVTEEYKIKYLITDCSNWLDTTSILKFFNGNLQSNINLNINARTMNNYVNKGQPDVERQFSKSMCLGRTGVD